ncbi:MFS transporter [Clostridium sp. 'deep sea']|nr:MFS transporter [Clostridium sp. 'deep sea']
MVADKFGYKTTLLISNIVFFISKIVFFRANSFGMFLAERVLLAIAIAGLSGCDLALLYSSAPKEKSQQIFGRYNALATVGYLLASLLSGYMVKNSLSSTAFYTIIPYALAIIFTVFIKEVNTDSAQKPKLKDSFKNAWSMKRVLILVVAIAFIKEVFQAVTVFLNQLQYLKCGIAIKYFGVIIVLIQVANLSSVKSHLLSKKFGKQKTIAILIIAILLSCIALIFTNNAILSVSFIFLISGSMSIINPIYAELQNLSITSGDRATVLSIYAMVGNVIAAVINPFIGKSADIAIETAFFTCFMIAMCGLLFFYLYIKLDKKHCKNNKN